MLAAKGFTLREGVDYNEFFSPMDKQASIRDIMVKAASIPLAAHFKLSKDQSPQIEDDRKIMDHIPYASVIGNLTYVMVYTRSGLGLAHAMSIISGFISNPGEQHWEDLKWIMRIKLRKRDGGDGFDGSMRKKGDVGGAFNRPERKKER
uniref:Uncharacterized protein n=1 Tax=Cannabis sativa TaxID=3483 RepID=A0A803QEG4_CANSA